MITTILAAIFVLGLLIFIHELGHFLAAKMVGIRVERFSIGFPPRLFGKKIGDTDYCISATPLGGYVKMAGMIDESMDKEGIKGEPWEFNSKPVRHRVTAIVAGPLMNYLLAIVLFSALVFYHGVGEKASDRIGEVVPDYPAQQAGLVAGDKIIAINDDEVNTWEEMTEIIHALPDRKILLKWEHDGEIRTAEVQTRAEELPTDDGIEVMGVIGISPEMSVKKVGFFTSIKYGILRTHDYTRLMFSFLKRLLTGKGSLKSMGGPLKIADMAGQSARAGLDSLTFFIAILSLNLAILNILPIPVLDGGHLIFLIFEGITRKQLSLKTRMVIQQVGMVLLLLLMVFITINDIRNF